MVKCSNRSYDFIKTLKVWLDCQHAADYPVADPQQVPGHAEGLLPQPEENAGDQSPPPADEGAPAAGGGQPRRPDR